MKSNLHYKFPLLAGSGNCNLCSVGMQKLPDLNSRVGLFRENRDLRSESPTRIGGLFACVFSTDGSGFDLAATSWQTRFDLFKKPKELPMPMTPVATAEGHATGYVQGRQ